MSACSRAKNTEGCLVETAWAGMETGEHGTHSESQTAPKQGSPFWPPPLYSTHSFIPGSVGGVKGPNDTSDDFNSGEAC